MITSVVAGPASLIFLKVAKCPPAITTQKQGKKKNVERLLLTGPGNYSMPGAAQ